MGVEGCSLAMSDGRHLVIVLVLQLSAMMRIARARPLAHPLCSTSCSNSRSGIVIRTSMSLFCLQALFGYEAQSPIDQLHIPQETISHNQSWRKATVIPPAKIMFKGAMAPPETAHWFVRQANHTSVFTMFMLKCHMKKFHNPTQPALLWAP